MACTIQQRAAHIASLQTPQQVSTAIRGFQRVTTADKTVQVWKEALLGPSTVTGNVLSDATMVAADLASTGAAAAIGSANRAMGGKGGVYGAEVGAKLSGMLYATSRAAEMARAAYGNGKQTAQGLPELHGPLGALDRYGFFAMVRSANAFIREIHYSGEIAALATRSGLNRGLTGAKLAAHVKRITANPEAFVNGERITYETLGRKAAEKRAFEAKSNTAERISKFGQIPHGQEATFMRQAVTLPSRVLLPFPRIMMNLSKATVEHSVFAPAIPEVYAALKKGGPEAQMALGRMAVGTGVAALVGLQTLKGRITGYGPTDPDERKAWLDADNEPYSIRLPGGHQFSYDRLAPFGSIVGMAADFVELGVRLSDGERDRVAAQVAHAIGRNMPLAENFSTLGAMMHAMTSEDRSGERSFKRLAGTLVPSVVAKTAKLIDPKLSATNGMLDEIRARLPVVSKGLAKQVDIWGETRKDSSPGISLFFPVKVRSISDDPVRQESTRLRMRLSAPDRSLDMPGQKKPLALDPKQYEALSRLVGQRAHENVKTLMQSDAWRNLKTDEQKQEAFKRAFLLGHKQGRNAFRAALVQGR